jgi:branched-chain amino acid transport system ATP-binding protein
MALLAVRSIGKTFGKLRALHDVSFELAAGEIVGLIGPNGAGKSTLVDIIAGRAQPSHGEVFLDGASLKGLPAFRIARRGIARTFQIASPFRDAGVLDSVLVGALNGRADKRVHLAEANVAAHAALAACGLEEHAAEAAEGLDIAGRKRLQLAQALALNPRVLLVDELMAGLPPVELDRFVGLLAQVRSGGVAILVIEHVMRAIAALADRVIVLHHGEKIAENTPQEVFRDAAVMHAYLGPRFTGSGLSIFG